MKERNVSGTAIVLLGVMAAAGFLAQFELHRLIGLNADALTIGRFIGLMLGALLPLFYVGCERSFGTLAFFMFVGATAGDWHTAGAAAPVLAKIAAPDVYLAFAIACLRGALVLSFALLGLRWLFRKWDERVARLAAKAKDKHDSDTPPKS